MGQFLAECDLEWFEWLYTFLGPFLVRLSKNIKALSIAVVITIKKPVLRVNNQQSIIPNSVVYCLSEFKNDDRLKKCTQIVQRSLGVPSKTSNGSRKQFYQIYNKQAMMQTDHDEQLQEADFPAFPVVFQQEFQSDYESSYQQQLIAFQNSQFSIPEQQLKSLLDLMQLSHDFKFSHLFTGTIEDRPYVIDNFFSQYQPLDEEFVRSLKSIMHELHIIRLSKYKIFVGEFTQELQCHGKGILIFKNGNLYEGHFSNNKRVGKGIYVQHGVGQYRGTFEKDLKHGEGIEILYKKSVYRGSFHNGLKHEKGLYADWEGTVFNGNWKLGIIHGKGILKTPNSIYIGSLVNWLKHGHGQQKFPNGDSYKGDYQNGRFDGNGAYFWRGTAATYEGSFKNGLRHGKGKWSAGNTKYNGSYSQGLKQGFGQLFFQSGNFYKGNFIQDKRDGYGEMFWTDGSFYKGEWKNGIQNGKGQLYMTGGQIISGLFQNSILVQLLPSIYEKQMQISTLRIHDMFGPKQNVEQSTKCRPFSESKTVNLRKKLTKINESSQRRSINHNQGTLKSNMYFRSPEKSQHSKQSGQDCKCVRRLEHFRLRLRKKTNLGNSSILSSNQY